MSITVTRILEFDAAHRLLDHKGKCRFLHGHRYKAEIEVYCPELDDQGMIVDFSFIKEKIGGWIDQNWDHNTILHPGDDLRYTQFLWIEKAPYIMPVDHPNPTAENLAIVLANIVALNLPHQLQLDKLTIWETPNCKACLDYDGG